MTAFLGVLQSWRRLLLVLPLAIVSIAVVTGYFDESFRPKLPKVVFSETSPTHPLLHRECLPQNETNFFSLLPSLLPQLWAPLLLPITEPSFTTPDGTTKHLPPSLIHTHPLGKRICILDVDTRPLSDPGNIFSPTALPTWSSLQPTSSGFLSHYLYSLIHGYTYKFIRAPSYPDRAPHWTKVIFTQELLKRFDIVIMMDYDTMFPSPEVPLEWLLNYWSIDQDVIVAMAEDPDEAINRDLKGNLNVNTGFIIAQSIADPNKTQELFKDWAECPEERRYKDCGQWRKKIFHEQAGFSSHVRYDFLEGLSVETQEGRRFVRVLPCTEANGIPETRHMGCVGQLVRHYWGDKGLTKREFGQGAMRGLVPLLVKGGFGDGEVVEDFRGRVLEGDEILGW